MTTTINGFYEKRNFYKNLSQTARMHVIKLDINHLKKYMHGEQKELKIDILSDKEDKHISIAYAEIEMRTVQLI
jgi:hypothetical protein